MCAVGLFDVRLDLETGMTEPTVKLVSFMRTETKGEKKSKPTQNTHALEQGQWAVCKPRGVFVTGKLGLHENEGAE